MKNKALTYVLLAVVAFIWYKVFFRVKDNLFGEEEQSTELRREEPQLPTIQRDTFELLADYRDPFGETKRQTQMINPEVQQVVQAPKPPKPQIIWPKIVYYGQVRRTTSKNPLGILSIDGYKHTLRRGEQVYDGIAIKAVGRDSIVIRYNRQTKIFWRD